VVGDDVVGEPLGDVVGFVVGADVRHWQHAPH
jgi:hypothetical protein